MARFEITVFWGRDVTSSGRQVTAFRWTLLSPYFILKMKQYAVSENLSSHITYRCSVIFLKEIKQTCEITMLCESVRAYVRFCVSLPTARLFTSIREMWFER